MTKVRSLVALALVAIALGTTTAAFAADANSAPTLYKRLGGYDAIAAVTDDFIGRLATDKQLSRFFVGHSQDSLGKIRQHVIDLICASTGGPCTYTGRDMKTSHKGMGITEADWNAAVADFLATLDKFKVPEKERKELVAIVASTKKDIVEKP